MLKIRFTSSGSLLIATIFLLLSMFDPVFSQPQKELQGTIRDKIVHQGAEVEFSIEPISSRELFEGDFATIQFKVKDATTGAPFPALRPSVWVDLQKDLKGEKSAGSLTCKEKIGLYMQGTLSYRPDIDLNSYFILSLNDDATIAVTNPIVSLRGITQLHAMVYLKRPGEDWVLSRDQKRLFVSMPKADQVAVVNTETFKLIKDIPAGSNPFRIALQPDGKYLWVGNNASEREKSGVTVIDAEELNVVVHIPTGSGNHEIVFSEDSLFAFITNRKEGTLSVIDVRKLVKIKDLQTGEDPATVAFSALSQSVYVVHEKDGRIAVVDGKRHEVVHQTNMGSGMKALRFAPGGRFGFVTNSKENLLHVFDASTNRIIHRIETGKEPDQISFTKTFAYIRSKGSTEVTLIQLSSLGKEGTIPVVRIPVGQKAPGTSPHHSVAEAIVPTPEEGHTLIANPADKMIYYYMEGMSGPMGSFRSYGGYSQKAVLVLDRSIREIGAGIYASRIRIPSSGKYQVAFLLDSPRILHCFEFSAKPNPILAKKGKEIPRMEFLTEERTLTVGKKFKLQFKLVDPSNDVPLAGVNDLFAQATLAPGTWAQKYSVRHTGNGVYEMDFTAPQKGIYYFNFASPSLKANFSQFPYVVLQAKENEN